MTANDEQHSEIGESSSLLTEQEPSLGKEDLSYLPIITKLYFLAFFFSIASQVLAPAQTKLYESIYCCQESSASDGGSCASKSIPEYLCKTPHIQQEVSILKGWLEFFDSIPTLILTIPFGVLADSRGRKKLLRLSITLLWVQQVWIAVVTACADTVPLRAIWFESFFSIFAGGQYVAEMLVVVCPVFITGVNGGRLMTFSVYYQRCRSS